MDVFISVSYLGAVSSNFNLHDDIVVDPRATGLSGDILALLRTSFGEGNWRDIMAFLSLVLQAKLSAAIAGQFPYQIPLSLPQNPFSTRMAEIEIDPASVAAFGLVCRRPQWNEFNPGLLVDTTVQRVQAEQKPILGNVKFPATEWGCPAVEFGTKRTFWDTTVSVFVPTR